MAGYGIEARHLRAVKAAADREVGLVEQVVTPLRRQRNPEARARADEVVREFGCPVRPSSCGARQVRTRLRRWTPDPAESRCTLANVNKLDVVGVRVECLNQPIVLLREEGGERYLPIWIGAVEATAIAFAQQGGAGPAAHARPDP